MSPSHPSKEAPASAGDEPRLITPELLREWPLPQPDEAGDKEERGRVVVVGGAPELPGAVILAATAALRAGAGKLRVCTPASVAPWVGMAVPESRVAALPEDEEGAVHANAVEAILRLARGAQAVLIGPGMLDEAAVADLVEALVPELIGSTLVLDAAALPCVKANPSLFHPLEGRAALTPHAGEMASMLGISKEEVLRDPVATARDAAARWGAVVALKGAETCIAAPDGTAFLNRTGNVGLATSGSGDTLAGIVAGLAARGADPLHACVWGVYLHGRAGDCLAQRMGRLGFLARELLAEVPVIMAGLADPDADPCKERIPF